MAKIPHKTVHSESGSDTFIKLTIPSFFTYTLIVMVLGSSIYTLLKAMPKLDSLDHQITEIDKSKLPAYKRSIDSVLQEHSYKINDLENKVKPR